MNNESCSIQTPGHCHVKRFCWTPVIVGSLVALGISFLLNLFSIAIGLSIVTTTKEGLVALAVGGFLGLLVGTIVAMFTGGFTAGVLARPYCASQGTGVLYGFTVWCFALLLGVIFSAKLGHHVAEYSSFISKPATVLVVENDAATSPNVKVHNTSSNNRTAAQPQVVADVSALGIGTFLVFVLFFVGALSSCLGGYFGLCRCKNSCCPVCKSDKASV